MLTDLGKSFAHPSSAYLRVTKMIY